MLDPAFGNSYILTMNSSKSWAKPAIQNRTELWVSYVYRNINMPCLYLISIWLVHVELYIVVNDHFHTLPSIICTVLVACYIPRVMHMRHTLLSFVVVRCRQNLPIQFRVNSLALKSHEITQPLVHQLRLIWVNGSCLYMIVATAK